MNEKSTNNPAKSQKAWSGISQKQTPLVDAHEERLSHISAQETQTQIPGVCIPPVLPAGSANPAKPSSRDWIHCMSSSLLEGAHCYLRKWLSSRVIWAFTHPHPRSSFSTLAHVLENPYRNICCSTAHTKHNLHVLCTERGELVSSLSGLCAQ